MAYWLLKSEPDEFSFADLCAREVEPWSGVRNYQARNFLRSMRVGDSALFYHSGAARRGVMGLAEIVRAAYPDPSQFDPDSFYYDPRSSSTDPRWSAVDVRAVRALTRFVSLEEMRQLPGLADFALLRRGNRLSVLPVTPQQWAAVLAMEELPRTPVAALPGSG